MKIIFGREEKTALMLLIMVVAISGAVYFLLESAGKESFAVPYDHSSGTGTLVIYDGVVDRIVYTKTGGHLIVGSGNETIFIRNGGLQKILAEPGLKIHAVGTIEIYNGEREIYVSELSDAFFTKISPAG